MSIRLGESLRPEMGVSQANTHRTPVSNPAALRQSQDLCQFPHRQSTTNAIWRSKDNLHEITWKVLWDTRQGNIMMLLLQYTVTISLFAKSFAGMTDGSRI